VKPIRAAETNAPRQIARAAGTVMAAFVINNVISLFRSILALGVFGTGMEMDAFSAANRVSETLFTLVAGGALVSAFIPTFTTLLTRGHQQRAWRLASAVGNLILVLLIAGCAAAAVFAPQIVRYTLASGFASDPDKLNLTVQLMRIMLPSAIFFGVSALAMGILNSHQVFLYPALAPGMYQLGQIFGIVVLAPRFGIHGLAWGVVLGSLLYLAVQLPALLRQKGEYFPTFGLDSPDVREVARLLAPRLFGVAVVQLNFWVNIQLASYYSGGVIGIAAALTLMLMPQAAIAQSIAIAAMPTFSAQAALGRLGEMRSSLAASVRGALLLSIPACLGLILLRKPVVAFLYQRGEFGPDSTELVAWALLWYAAGLVAHSLVEILARAFYALHDTKTPVMVGVVAMSLNILFSLVFTRLFALLGWAPFGGLALANSVATALEMAGLLALMRRRLNGLQGRDLLACAAQSGLAALLMGLALLVWLQAASGLPNWFIVLGGVALGGGIYALAAYGLKIREVRGVAQLAAQKAGQVARARLGKRS
jgi:putative peptidoglycan lipid II flippase